MRFNSLKSLRAVGAQDLHQSYSSKWAQLRHSKSLGAVKSSAVREAQERRAAAADAKARGKR